MVLPPSLTFHKGCYREKRKNNILNHSIQGFISLVPNLFFNPTSHYIFTASILSKRNSQHIYKYYHIYCFNALAHAGYYAQNLLPHQRLLGEILPFFPNPVKCHHHHQIFVYIKSMSMSWVIIIPPTLRQAQKFRDELDKPLTDLMWREKTRENVNNVGSTNILSKWVRC